MNDSRTDGSICAETEPTVRTFGDLIKVYQTDRVST
jgi:hypothetical protein